MLVAIYGRLVKPKNLSFIKELITRLKDHAFEIVVYEDYYKQLMQYEGFQANLGTFKSYYDIKDNVDYLFSLGGDGSLLDTVALVRDSDIPVMGINLGRLGFLSSTGMKEIDEAMEAVRNRTYVNDRRTLIHLDSNENLFGEVNFGLNEFTIHKKDTSSMITIHTYVNGELLNSYWADGLIVSTPTGSTGYSLSCGGPIIFPSSENFVITPVAPHNLNVRPIVLSHDAVISFEIEGRGDSFLCTLDSRYATIDSTAQLAVRKADFGMTLIRLSDVNFMNTIRNKLAWGLDQRKND